MAYRVVIAATVEPVSLAEARLQCKIDSDNTAFDALLQGLISAARAYAEHYTGRSFAEQTLEQSFPAFGDLLQLDLGPVATIASIKYTDTDGDEQTLDPAAYYLSPYGEARIVTPAFGVTWPATQAVADAVRVQFETGAECPAAAKQAMLIHIELESPLNPQTAEERKTKAAARDALLDTVKVY